MRIGRSSGILLHITSLPGKFGIGDLGPESRNFVDFLHAAKQKLWCVLPLGLAGEENSPYRSPSAFAGNTMMISPELLLEEGYVGRKDVRACLRKESARVDFSAVRACKEKLLKKAFLEFRESREYVKFTRANSVWLHGYAVFMATREANGGAPWAKFDPGVKPAARTIRYHKFVQYEFFRQWSALRKYCEKREVSIMGDMPFYVEHDSADVWSNPRLFDLLKNGEPAHVGGVPPDYFSKDGQLWGTPVYRWDRLAETGFAWWVERFRATFRSLDLLRLDHFRGFEAFWSVPAKHTTAREGRWKKGPGVTFFQVVQKKLGKLPVVAENLGVITKEVESMRRAFAFPGMAVLQFGFDEQGFHRPDNYSRELVAFTGTHDNDTTRGWWNSVQRTARRSRAAEDRAVEERVKSYLQTEGREIHWAFIRALLTSVADVAVIPMQDMLGLGSKARMNVPGHAKGNWSWRLLGSELERADVQRLRALTMACGRGGE